MPSSPRLTRRQFLKASALFGTALLAGAAYRHAHNTLGRDFQPQRAEAYRDSIRRGLRSDGAVPTTDLPNIVILLADDLGYGDLASPAIDTPNLDRMAREGVSLSSFYTASAVCSPSRAALLTGRYPPRTLITNPLHSTHDAMNLVMDALGRYSYNVRGIPQDEVLLPEVLQRCGYRTALVGKWHLGGTPGHLPNDRGFDAFYGALWSNDDQPYAIYRDRQVELPAPADQSLLTQNLTREALDFIQSSADQPFFLYLAHAMPHVPIHTSVDYRGASRAGLYGDAVQEIDWSVGQVLESLMRLGLDEKTLVVFSSDNGPWWEGSPGLARGRKLTWFEGGCRLPFIARWPGIIPPGSSRGQMCMNFDLFPTCLAMAGVPPPQDRVIDGADILPLLKGEAPSPHEALFFFNTRDLVGVRQGRWKYYRKYITDNASFWPLRQGPFLFDLESDPSESYSLVESQPALAAHLAALLDDFELQMDANLRGWLD